MTEITWRAVPGGDPCPVCGSSTKGCSRTADAFHLCRGRDAAGDGWRLLKACDNGFYCFRAADDWRDVQPAERSARRPPRPAPEPKGPPPDVAAIHARLLALPDCRRHVEDLASHLQVTPESLEALGCCWWKNGQHNRRAHAWATAEKDAQGRVVTLLRRFHA